MKTISERLAHAMRQAKLTDYRLAQLTGVPQPTIYRIVSGKTLRPQFDTLDKLAGVLGIRVDWLYTGEGAMYTEAEGETESSYPWFLAPRLELYASSQRGRARYELREEAPENYGKSWLDRHDIAPGDLVSIRASGDSMEGYIADGDYLLVNRAMRDIHSGKIYALLRAGELIVKRLFRRHDGALRLVSENSSRYPEEIIPASQLESIDIIGRVVWRAGDI